MSTTDVLQSTLAAEHAAVHLLGHLGGVVPPADQPDLHQLVRERHQRHRAAREYLTTTLRASGETPVAAEAAYALPDDTDDEAAVRREGVRTEELCCEAYATLVASSSNELRAWAMAALDDAARAQVAWGGAPTPFPGAPELAG